MTLTIELPDEEAALFQKLAESSGQDIETLLIDAAVRGIDSFVIAGNRRALSEGKPLAKAKRKPRRWSVTDFAGVAAGRPGAISSDGTDVDAYINKMRDDWDERDKEIESARTIVRP